MQQLKFNTKFSSNSELAKRKSATTDELLAKQEIKDIVEKLDVSMNEFDYYLGYFLSYYEDKCCCKTCSNIEKCPKEIKGMMLNLVRKEDNSIETSFETSLFIDFTTFEISIIMILSYSHLDYYTYHILVCQLFFRENYTSA